MSAAVLTILSLCALPLAGAALLGAIAYRIATGCRHKWTTFDQYELRVSDLEGGRRTVGIRYHLRCERCGAIKVAGH